MQHCFSCYPRISKTSIKMNWLIRLMRHFFAHFRCNCWSLRVSKYRNTRSTPFTKCFSSCCDVKKSNTGCNERCFIESSRIRDPSSTLKSKLKLQHIQSYGEAKIGILHYSAFSRLYFTFPPRRTVTFDCVLYLFLNDFEACMSNNRESWSKEIFSFDRRRGSKYTWCGSTANVVDSMRFALQCCCCQYLSDLCSPFIVVLFFYDTRVADNNSQSWMHA